MGKQQRDTPKFLKSQLSDERKSKVRKEWPLWLAKEKARQGKQPEMSHELLVDFIGHLGVDDRDYRNIASKAIKTSHKGTLFIYDYMRKHLGPMDEKPATPTPGKTTASPRKDKSPEPKDAKMHNDAPVQITANNNNEFGDEKDVRFYKVKGSDDDSSEAENPSSNEGNSREDEAKTNEGSEQLGKPEHQELKQLIIEFLDACSMDKIGGLEFTWNANGTVTFQANPPKPTKQ